ncbi:hypothetical protein OG625_39935 (plasmid) [Streptomyces sp. NBC_01351]|uniref:IclR family transcriptional regulator domain-containing protein n=1 Tax=Streptomyces sp. NBC_01351 TaxID=2903833 RepID=UPI002E3012FE|nr:IclR family transcriptional regulator C-terminal domain-containing protein [Streptomyces sp. NBC_01351]
MSRNDSGRGPRPGYALDGFAAVLSGLKGPKDYWDRPDGNWGLLIGPRAVARRRHANSCYRLGSKALRAGDWQRAAAWLTRARAERHPGAAFRMAVVLWRTAAVANDQAGRGQDIVAAVMDAARFGHGDAQRLLEENGWSVPSATEQSATAVSGSTGAARWQDPAFADAVAEALAVLRPGVPRARRRPLAPQEVLTDEEPSSIENPSVALGSVNSGGARWEGGEQYGESAIGFQLGTLWAPPSAATDPGHTPRQWEDSLRILDVLQLIRETGPGVPTEVVATTAGITTAAAAELLVWLSETSLTRRLSDGTWEPGPLLERIDRGEDVLKPVLDQLMEDTGAAVYVSTYDDGEIVVPHSAFGPTAPEVTVTAEFCDTAHASAVGKALLSQLDEDARKEHLSRRPTIPLTSRTITDHLQLFDDLDRYGPEGTHFDKREYSDDWYCVAVSLPLPDRACCVAVALPVARSRRLLKAADILSNRSTGLLLALVLATYSAPQTDKPRKEDQPSTDDHLTKPVQNTAPLESSLFVPPSGLLLPPSLTGRHTTTSGLLIVSQR